MSWNKLIFTLAAAAACLQTPVAQADRCVSDCGFSLCECDPCDGWTFYADWLYWNTRKGDLDYAFELDINGFITSEKEVCPQWDSGVRVGFLKACGELDAGLHYTYYNNDYSSTTTRDDGFLGRSQIGAHYAETADGVIEYAKGDYEVTLNQVDLELGYRLDVSDCLKGRAFAGFRWACIDQEFDVHYANDQDDTDGSSSENPVDKVKKSNDMEFYGLYLGSKAVFAFSDCLDFFGSFSWGIGAAEFDRSFKVDTNEGGATDFTTKVKFGDDCWRAVSVMDLSLGMTYYTTLCNCGDFALSFGYEFHHWLNTADFIGLNSGDTSGENHIDRHTDSLGFDGFFVRIGFGY